MVKILYDKVNKRIVRHWFVDNEGNFYINSDPYGVQMSGKITIVSVQNNANYEKVWDECEQEHTEQLKAESITEYISRLKEVLKQTGALTERDIDYVYELMQHDLKPSKDKPWTRVEY